jgi:hypothetical protein
LWNPDATVEPGRQSGDEGRVGAADEKTARIDAKTVKRTLIAALTAALEVE